MYKNYKPPAGLKAQLEERGGKQIAYRQELMRFANLGTGIDIH